MRESWEDARHDEEADRAEQRARLDRQLEHASHPSMWLGPLERCRDCGCIPKEIAPGHWGCACALPVGVGASTHTEGEQDG